MQRALKSLVERRSQRAVATIMGVVERDIYPHLDEAERRKLRGVIRDTIYDFRTVVTDLMEELDTGEVILNELWIAKIDEMHQVIVPGRAPTATPMAEPGHRTPSEFGSGRPIATP